MVARCGLSNLMWVEMKLVAAAVIVLLVLDSVLGVVLMLASKPV